MKKKLPIFLALKLAVAFMLLSLLSSCADDEPGVGEEISSGNKMLTLSVDDFLPEASIRAIDISDDGSTIAITDWNSNSRSGTVKVFRNKDDEWLQIGESFSGSTDDEFGLTISLNSNGNRVAIGAPSHDFKSGAVFIYEYSQDNWGLIGQISGKNWFTSLGVDIELDAPGTRVAVISNLLGPFGFNALLSIHEESDSDWVSIIENFDNVMASDVPLPSMAFNAEGSKVFLGYHHNTGFVDAYSVNGSELISIGDRIEGENELDGFGNIGINSNGSALAIGGPNYPTAENIGIVKVYHDDSGWTQKGSSLLGNKDDRFGRIVALNESATRLVVGAGVGFNGYVKVYDFLEEDWSESMSIIRDDLEGTDFGLKLSSDGNTLVLLLGQELEIWVAE